MIGCRVFQCLFAHTHTQPHNRGHECTGSLVFTGIVVHLCFRSAVAAVVFEKVFPAEKAVVRRAVVGTTCGAMQGQSSSLLYHKGNCI